MKSFWPLLLLLITASLWSACGTASQSSTGKNFPSKPITLLVPWSPGGGTDLSSRTLAVALEKALGQPVNVVNRTGGGGVVGHLAMSQARPDGYTLGAITGEITMMHWMGMTDLTYEQYTPLALTMNNPASITVRADAPWQNLQELIADLQANPGKFKASGTSRGGIWDLARIGFLQAIELEEDALPWVPSQGAAPALQELLAGGVEIVTTALAEVAPLLQAGEVRVLGVMSAERLPAFPEVPTLQEQGIDWEIGGWVGLCGPANLPTEVVEALTAAMEKVNTDPAYQQAMEQAGFYRQFLDQAAFASFLLQQDQINGALMEKGGLKR